VRDDDEEKGPDLEKLKAVFGVSSNVALLSKALRIAQNAAKHEATAPIEGVDEQGYTKGQEEK
jgi:hypothetical protein